MVEKYFLAYKKDILYENNVRHFPVIEPDIQMSVRQASLKDMENLVEMRTQVQNVNVHLVNKDKYFAKVLERLKVGHSCFIAEQNNEILGYIWIAFHELYDVEIKKKILLKNDQAVFYDAYTFSSYRGRGVMSKIYEQTINHLRKNNFKKAYVMVEQHNASSRRAAQKLNFKPILTITFVKFLWINKIQIHHIAPVSAQLAVKFQ